MNKKQWFVWGIGLILFSFFLSSVGANTLNCEYLNEKNIELINSGGDGIATSAMVTSCFEIVIIKQGVSSIIFTAGILFVICGFLEPKQKHKQ
jgi:hypothetical protein